jgi:redox-sensitive bicupin YhaK (pirin superfamily)
VEGQVSEAGIDIRRSGDRFRTTLDWLDSRHSFAFGPHHDPTNTHYASLVVNNEDTLAAGPGYESHSHRDMEILTWVLSGALVHEDSDGNTGVIHPGLVQRMSAGSGIRHSERSDSSAESARSAHFVQMWLMPDQTGVAPGYQQVDVDDDLDAGALITVASGMSRHRGDVPIWINNSNAALHIARLPVGQEIEVPDAPYLHLFVAKGSAQLEGDGMLEAGDAARLTALSGHRVTAAEPCEVLIWEMHASL